MKKSKHENEKCPCGSRITPDPCCDMCDRWTSDPDTGWGGYTNHYLGKHFNNEKEEEYRKSRDFEDEEDNENSYFGY